MNLLALRIDLASLASSLAFAGALALVACGGSAPDAATTPAPLAAIDTAGCALDAAYPLGEGALVVLESSHDLTAAQARYRIDSFGQITTSGTQMGESTLPPQPDAIERAADLYAALRDTGVHELEPGCYAESLGEFDTRAITLVVPYEGQVLRFATREGHGPAALQSAIRLVQGYVQEQGGFTDAVVEETMRSADDGTTVEVVRVRN